VGPHNLLITPIRHQTTSVHWRTFAEYCKYDTTAEKNEEKTAVVFNDRLPSVFQVCELPQSERARGAVEHVYFVKPLLMSFEKINETSLQACGGMPSDIISLELPVSMALTAFSSGFISSSLSDRRSRKSSSVWLTVTTTTTTTIDIISPSSIWSAEIWSPCRVGPLPLYLRPYLPYNSIILHYDLTKKLCNACNTMKILIYCGPDSFFRGEGRQGVPELSSAAFRSTFTPVPSACLQTNFWTGPCLQKVCTSYTSELDGRQTRLTDR